MGVGCTGTRSAGSLLLPHRAQALPALLEPGRHGSADGEVFHRRGRRKSHPEIHAASAHTNGGRDVPCVAQAREKAVLVFKMPIIPIPADSAEAQQVRTADYNQHLEQLRSAWEKLVNQDPPLRFPEEKVQQYLLANTVFDLLAIDKVSGDLIQNVNKFQYHDPYGAANTMNMLVASLYTGLDDIVRNSLLYFYKVQQPDGSFIMDNHPKSLYWELFGYTLWGWGRYYQLTRDDDFLRQVYPGVVRAMEWQKKISDADPLGLMPPSTISDDAYLKTPTRQA